MSNITHARTNPNVHARKVAAVEFLAMLAHEGGTGRLRGEGRYSEHSEWRWLQERGHVGSDAKNWWITARGRFTLECWGK